VDWWSCSRGPMSLPSVGAPASRRPVQGRPVADCPPAAGSSWVADPWLANPKGVAGVADPGSRRLEARTNRPVPFVAPCLSSRLQPVRREPRQSIRRCRLDQSLRIPAQLNRKNGKDRKSSEPKRSYFLRSPHSLARSTDLSPLCSLRPSCSRLAKSTCPLPPPDVVRPGAPVS
jgi:hypothetical protein